jgi:hypothetical protein
MENAPDEIVVVYNTVGPEPGRRSEDPVGDPQGPFVKKVNDDFLGSGALEAAKGPASAPRPPTYLLPLMFQLDGESVSLELKPGMVSDTLIGLYIAGGWAWAQAFLHAFLDAIGRDSGVPSLIDVLQMRAPAAKDPGRAKAFAEAVSKALPDLNGLISNVLVEIAQRTIAKAHDLAAVAGSELTVQAQLYDIRPVRAQQPASGGTEGRGEPTSAEGGDTGGAGGGTGGGSGSEPKVTEAQGYAPADPTKADIVADLVSAIQQLVNAYSTLETEQTLADASAAETHEGSPTSAPPPPATGQPTKLEAAAGTLSKLLKETTGQHKLAPGIVALCLSKRSDAGDPFDKKIIYSCTAEYIASARESLAQIPVNYNATGLREALAKSTQPEARALEVSLADTPEARAAVFAGRGTSFEPLMADQLLERVRRDIVNEAKTARNDDEAVRALFALAVINSYLAASDARDVVPRAQAARAREPLQALAKISAALSLVGLLVPPLGVVGTIIGLYTVYGDALSQLDEVVRLNTRLDTRALETLLSENQAAFAQTLAAKPRPSDVYVELATSFIGFALAGRLLPRLALGVSVVSDAKTLLLE